jgi:hypothetical protein
MFVQAMEDSSTSFDFIVVMSRDNPTTFGKERIFLASNGAMKTMH